MMALNIAVPIPSVGDLLEVFGLLSPISPVNIDCHSGGLKALVSPVGSESSGVSSLDLEDLKKQIPSSPTLSDDNDEASASGGDGSGSSSDSSSSSSSASTISTTSTRTSSTSSSSSSSSTDDESAPNNSEESNEQLPPSPTAPAADSSMAGNEKEGVSGNAAETLFSQSLSSPVGKVVPGADLVLPAFASAVKEPIFSLPRRSIRYANRDILDLASNVRSPTESVAGFFKVHYAELPETDSIQFFLNNRSQYHRLGPNGHVQEYRMAGCNCCDFKNSMAANSGSVQQQESAGAIANAAKLFKELTPYQAQYYSNCL
uniref:Uncharacterized protein n=1 Tax=Anopheles albimanus TaxID=7167 RepID=A0A182F292_ANOAL